MSDFLIGSPEILSNRLGYTFKDIEILERALTHTSWCNESAEDDRDNERLEFLGDAVLELSVSDMLFHQLPDVDEGPLTQRRALLVNTGRLAEIARGIELGEFLRLGVGEEKSGGRNRASNLANALEAVVGAVYLDGGFLEAKRVVAGLLKEALEQLASTPLKDARSRLQEWAQSNTRSVPRYTVEDINAPNEEPHFQARVRAGQIHGQGVGRTKKEAIHNAAAVALAIIEGSGDKS